MTNASIKRPTLDAIVARVTSISTIPQVALNVVRITKDPLSNTSELQHIVECDPAMTVKLLQMINSAAFALRKKVTNLKQAIGLLGFNKIRDIALTTSVAEVFKTDCVFGCYRRKDLWRHILASAICSELVALKCDVPGCEDAFAAGLLHDLGIILEDQYAHDMFRALIESVEDSTTLTELEKANLGFDHTALGARVAEKWRFPEPIRAAMRFHHMPQNYRGDHGGIVNTVAVANALVSSSGFPSLGKGQIRNPQSAFDALDLDVADMELVVTELRDRVTKEASLSHGTAG